MNPSLSSAATAGPGTYTPGYSTHKRAMLIGGLMLAAFGAFELWTPLRLALFGERAKAEAIRVVKEKAGLPPIILTNEAQVQAQLEPRDRSFVFWNEFKFSTPDGRVVEVRAGIGSHLKPLYSLTDADGLPTSDVVFYDPTQPERAIFPLIISTWFAPVALFLLGLSTALIGIVLLRWSRRPIELPHIQVGGAPLPDDTK